MRFATRLASLFSTLGCTCLFIALTLCSARADMVAFRQGESPSAAYEHLGAQLQPGFGNTGGDIFLRAGLTNAPGGVGPIRSVLSFNLSAIASGSTVTSVTLDLALGVNADANPIEGVELHPVAFWAGMVEGTVLQGSPTADGVSWLDIRPMVPWTTAGGDFLATLLSSIGPDPTAGTAGQAYTFGNSLTFVAAAQSALDNSIPLQLLMFGPAAETRSAQNFYRFASDDYPDVTLRPKLTVEFTPVPEPSALVLAVLAAAFGSIARRLDRCR